MKKKFRINYFTYVEVELDSFDEAVSHTLEDDEVDTLLNNLEMTDIEEI